MATTRTIISFNAVQNNTSLKPKYDRIFKDKLF